MNCGLRTTYIKQLYKGKTERNGKRTSKNSSPSFNIPLAVYVVYSSNGDGRLCRYSGKLKLNSEFYKKKELEEISICSFKPKRSTEWKKIVFVLVRSVKFLSDATIPFQIKPWKYVTLFGKTRLNENSVEPFFHFNAFWKRSNALQIIFNAF